MECLQACRLGEVGVVGVWLKAFAGVRGIFGREIGGEIVEPSIMGVSNGSDGLKQALSSFWRGRSTFHKAEAKYSLEESLSVPLMLTWETTYYLAQKIA